MTAGDRQLRPERWLIPGWLLIVTLFAFEAQLIRMPFDMSWGDEGFFANGALRVLDGQVPYLDFQHNYTPGRIFSLALLVKGFGHDLAVVRLFWCALYALATALTFLVSRRLMPLPWAVVAAISVALNASNMNKSVELAASAVILFALARWLEGSGRAFTTGVLMGLVFLFRQDTGVVGGGLFALSLVVPAVLASGHTLRERLWARLRSAWPFLVGFLAPIAPVLLYLAWNGALSAGFHDVLLAGFVANRALSLPFPSLLQEARASGLLPALTSQTMLFYTPPLLGAAGATASLLMLRRGPREAGHLLLLTSALGIALFLQVLPRSDWPHLQKAYLPFHVLGLFFAFYAFDRAWRYLRQGHVRYGMLLAPVVVVALAIPVLQIRWSTLHGVTPWTALRYGGRLEIVEFPHGELRVGPHEAAALRRIVDVVQRRRVEIGEGQGMLTFPSGALFNFLFGIPSPLRNDTLRPGELHNNDPVVLDEIMTTFERARPQFLLHWIEGSNPELVARLREAAAEGYRRVDAGQFTLYVRD